MPESKVSDSLEESIVPRKRGRPPKSKDSLLNPMLDDNKSQELFAPQENCIPQESKTSSLNNVLKNDKFDDSSEELSLPRKRGRPPKSKLSSQDSTPSDKKFDDASKELDTPCKRGRGRPRKSDVSSLKIMVSEKIVGDVSENVDILQINSSPFKPMSLLQKCISSDQRNNDVCEELVHPPKKGRGRPPKSKSSSLSISSIGEIASDPSEETDILEISDSLSKLIHSPLTSLSNDKKLGNVYETSLAAQKKGKPLKSKSSSLNISTNGKKLNIALERSPISGNKSKQLKLDFLSQIKSPKSTDLEKNSSPKILGKNSEEESGELKFYPIFNSPTLNNKKNNINQGIKINESNCNNTYSKILANSVFNEIEVVNLVEDATLNDAFLATDINSGKISDLDNSINHNVEQTISNVQQICSNAQGNLDNSPLKVINQTDVSDENLQSSKVKLKQKREKKQNTNVKVSSVSNSSLSNENESQNFFNDSVINSDLNTTNNLRKGKSENINNNVDCSISSTPNRHSLEVVINELPKEGDTNESKEKIKLFLTFTSNKALSVRVNTENNCNKTLMNSDSNLSKNNTVISKKLETVTLNDSSTSIEIEILKELCESDISKKSECVILNDSSAFMEIEMPEEIKLCESKANEMNPPPPFSVQKICFQETVDCDVIEVAHSIDEKNILNENTDTGNLENNSDSTLKSKQKKKLKKAKSIKTISKNEIVDLASDTEMPNRRKSLRNRGVRDIFFNYSEDDHDVDVSEAPKEDKDKLAESGIEINNDCVNDDSSKPLLVAEFIDLPKVQEKGKSQKENDKLFPIFKSNKACSDENNINSPSNKRKNPCDVVIIDNNTDEKYHKVKKTKSEINNQSSENCTTNINKQAESDPKCIVKKTYNIDTEIICFPKLSHVNIYSETQPVTINNFQIIAEDVDYNISVPVWKENENIVDVKFDEVIKSLEDDSHLHKELKNNLTESSSSVSINKDNESDVLWTDSVQNTVSKGKENEDLVNQVKSWLLQWKDKFSKTAKSRGYSSSDSDSYSGSDSDDDFISNCIILYGTPGSGKTSLVFSLADELGFTVLEMNASSHRNGRNISHKLKEALESYHMEGIKIEDVLENSKSENKKKCFSDKLEKSPSKNIKSLFEVGNEETKEKNKSVKKKNIASFFVADDSKKVKSKNEKKECITKSNSVENSNDIFKKINAHKKSCRISSSTIILFDDVDIVFEEDDGFWSTVKGFLKISKKPVIFTVSRNLHIVKSILNSDIQIFNMMPASKDSALETLKTCCMMHSGGNSNVDIEFLTSQNPNDLRRSILNTQFWSKTTKTHNNNSPSVLSNSSRNHSKLVRFNNFIAGDLIFSAKYIKELLFKHLPNYSLSAVSDYHRLGYDVLFSNYFSILSILEPVKHEKVWKILSDQNSCNISKSFSDSQMWEEACEIFKQKKKALKSGSCSKDLFVISDIVDDFSFADMLKGLSPSKNQGISVSERIKLWTAGLPICNDHVLLSYEDILQIISLIHIYTLRKAENKFVTDKISDDNVLILEHPFSVYDQAFFGDTENDLICLSEALPISQQMNKTSLVLDYLSVIKNICKDEESRQISSGKRSGRFLHYFDSISFLIDRKEF